VINHEQVGSAACGRLDDSGAEFPAEFAAEYLAEPTNAADGPPKKARTRSQIAKANLAKGKAGERDVVNYLRVHGFPGAERTVRTGYRVKGRESVDRGDIDGTPGLCWQVKYIAEREWWRIPGYLRDTQDQAAAAGADFGILVIRRAGHGHPSEWWAHTYLRDLVDLLDIHHDHPDVDTRFPVRFELQHLIPILRNAGYGTPLDGEEDAP
jgi:hypothetical protein